MRLNDGPTHHKNTRASLGIILGRQQPVEKAIIMSVLARELKLDTVDGVYSDSDEVK